MVKRTNQFIVETYTKKQEKILKNLLQSSAVLWNKINYERQENFYDDESIWNIPDIEKDFQATLGSSTTQQIKRKNAEAWRSFFNQEENSKETQNNPPGYWGNKNEGWHLKTILRNDAYSLEQGEESQLNITIGSQLKEKLDISRNERLTLKVKGKPHWKGENCRLEIEHDEIDNVFRVYQTVEVQESPHDSVQDSQEAALDIGANNLIACTTSTGKQYLYQGRKLYKQFKKTTHKIAYHQEKLEENQYSSHRIRRLYRKRSRRRDHAQDALARDLMKRLSSEGVSTVYVGYLTNVLETHWSPEFNEKTHNFWAYRAFIHRLACTAWEYGITLEVESEVYTSSECPECGSRENCARDGDLFKCKCGFEGHADLSASRVFLEREASVEVCLSVGSMARPVCLEWDDHSWSEVSYSPVRASPKKEHTNQSNSCSEKLPV